MLGIKSRKNAAIVLAGGEGTRLMPLTEERTKPAVPIFGTYRVGDFVLSSAVQSQIFGRIMVLVQYKSDSFIRHLNRMYPSAPQIYDRYIDVIPPQQRKGKNWFLHTADAVWQNEHQWREHETVAILSADHVTKIDFSQMYAEFFGKRSDFLIAGMVLDVSEAAKRFGVFSCDKNFRINSFEEKPEKPAEIPGQPGKCFASAGIYMADVKKLHAALKLDAKNSRSSHDFGSDVIPWMIANGYVMHCYDLNKNIIEGEAAFFWEDVGKLSTYLDINIAFARNELPLNFHNDHWLVRSFNDNAPPTEIRGVCDILNAKLGAGMVVEKDVVIRDSVFSPKVILEAEAEIRESVLFHRVTVGRNSLLKRVIVDKDIIIPPNTVIGLSREDDKARGFHVDDEAEITVIPKGYRF